MVLNVNGEPHDVLATAATTLLEALRSSLGADRHEARLQPWCLRRVHRTAGRQARAILSRARDRCRRAAGDHG